MMPIGCHCPSQGLLARRDALVALAQAAEHRGMDSPWVSHHAGVPRTATGSDPGPPVPHPVLDRA